MILFICQASELNRLTSAREAELKYVREQNDQMIAKDRELAKIEINKFQQQIQAIGTDTIRSIATAGPDHQVSTLVRLLRSSSLTGLK